MPQNPGTINEISPFAPNAQEETGQLMPLAAYRDDPQRTGGMLSGIASRGRFNRVLRQVSHMAAGLAQFVSNRHVPGIRDNGNLDQVEAALVGALKSFTEPALDSVTLAAGVAAGANYTVPEYKVGSRKLVIFLQGQYCRAGATSAYQYKEVGANGALSTTVNFYDALKAGWTVVALVLP